MNSSSSTSKFAPIQGAYYSLIRICLGVYLAIHFCHLLPWASEIFSEQGVLSAALSPFYQRWPNPLELNAPWLLYGILIVGALSAVLVCLGVYDRVSALIIVLILSFLYARNPLIANPSLPVVGWMLLAHCFIPRGVYGALKSKAQTWSTWFYPKEIWFAAWFMLALAYTYSGYTKLLSASWLDGSAIALVLENPLARDHFMREVLLSFPDWVLKSLTWLILIIELVFLPACLFKKLRPWFWLAMLAVQFGFLTFLNFADLTTPMLLIHALTFDRRWLKPQYENNKITLFYDGQCAFCSAIVKFSLVEDAQQRIFFAPLFEQTYKHIFEASKFNAPADDSIVLLVESIDGQQQAFYKSTAAAHLLMSLGGFWKALGWLIQLIPKALADFIYDGVGKIRYKLAGRTDKNICELLPAVYAKKILP